MRKENINLGADINEKGKFHPMIKNLKYDRRMNFNTEITMLEANTRTEKKNFSTQ